MGILLDLILVLCIFLVFAIKSSFFQTWVAHRVADYLSSELNAEVRIERVEIVFFDYVAISGVFVGDQRKDTIAYIPEILCSIDKLSFRKEEIEIGKAELINPIIKLCKYEGDTVWNYDFIEEYFSSEKKEKDTTAGGFEVSVKKIALVNARFNYNNYNKPYDEHGIDFTHLCLTGINLDCSNFYQNKDTSFVKINRLWAKDCSGFVLDTLSANLKIHEKLMSFDNLIIKTPTSFISTPNLSFIYESFDDFDDFEDKVIMKTRLNKSIVDLDDIAFFANDLWGINQTVSITSRVHGTVNDLSLKKLELIASDNTYLRGTIHMIGITDVENAFIDAKLDEFSTNRRELVAIQLPPFDGTKFIELPGRYARFGEILGNGSFTGTPSDFVAYGEFRTDVGVIKTDIKFLIDTTDNYYHYKGELVTEGFRAGYFYDIPDFGSVDLDINVDAKGLTIDDLQAKLNGVITGLDYMGYHYKNIKLDGVLHKEYFKGNVDVKDPNLDLVFDGTVNFAKKDPVFNFAASLNKSNLTILKLVDRDTSSNLTFKIKANAVGSNLDNFEGSLQLSDINFYEKGKDYHLGLIDLNANYEKDTVPKSNAQKAKDLLSGKSVIASKSLTLNSELFSAAINGRFRFEDVHVAFLSIISEVLPALFDNKPIKLKQDQEFNFALHLKDMDYISELFFPDITISKDVEFTGKFNSAENIFRIKSNTIDFLNVNGTQFSDLSINAKNNGDYLQLATKARKISLTDTMSLQNFRLDGELYQNKLATQISWANPDLTSEGMISGIGIIKASDTIEFDIQPSYITLNGEKWELGASSHLAMQGSTFVIDDFNLSNNQQSVAVTGLISEQRNDMLNIDICNFDLANLNPIFGSSDLEFSGTLNGNGFVADLYHNVFFASDIKLDSFYINKDYLGNFKLVNLWDNEQKRIRTTGELSRKEIKNIQFSGYYYTERDDDNLDFVIEMEHTNLQFLNSFIPEDISNLRGLATGNITIKGSTSEPKIKGKINFENGAIKVNMLNTEYYFGGMVQIEEDMIAFDTIPLADVKGNLGWARGTIYHKNFDDWNMDCDIDFKKLLCLNTTEEMNPVYYGRAYATGNVNVFMYNENIEINMNVKTEKGTKIIMPLYGTSDETIQDFVRFVVKDSSNNSASKVDLSGITMNFNFDVTPDAEVQIVFDKLAGDMMKGRGAGHLQMEIDRYGEFTMYGQYIVDQGDYLFTLMNVINKRFSVRKGSTISWYGDPLAADIDLKAIYKVSASVADIMPVDLAPNYKKNVEVECEMSLKHNLFKPDISFDIRVPRGDEEVRSALTMIRASEQELSRQFFSLMAINKFLPLSNSISNAGNNAMSGINSTLSELVSSQMSNWLSQISDEFDVGLNYRPGDEISSEEIAVALSTQLFNDRLILNTNLGVSKGNSANQNPNQLIGDFNVEYKINEEGTFRIRGFNESNEFDITRTAQSPYTQGVGVYYTEEFDKMGDIKIFKKIKSWFKKKDNKEDKKKKNNTVNTAFLGLVRREEEEELAAI